MATNSDFLINTKLLPIGVMETVKRAWESEDYFNLRPYPTHAFNSVDWNPSRGKIPTALPHTQIIIDAMANFIFSGDTVKFSVADNDKADTLLQTIIKSNRLSSRYVDLAKVAGNHGTIVAKFSVDVENRRRPIAISFHTSPQEVQLFYNPFDNNELLMARLQYPYQDLNDGHWYMYREEWTEDKFITYEPLSVGQSSSGWRGIAGYSDDLVTNQNYIISKTIENPFGVIPFTPIKNKSHEGFPLGFGTCWNSFRLQDRLALAMHNQDVAGQIHTAPTTVITDANLQNENTMLEGEILSIQSASDGHQANIQLLEPSGNARQWDLQMIELLKKDIYESCGMNYVNNADVTNKGNLTEAVMENNNQKTIQTANTCRANWGESGLCLFFSNMLNALDNIGGFKELKGWNQDTQISCQWGDYFGNNDEDLSDVTNRTVTQLKNNVVTQEVAAKRIAQSEGMPEDEIAVMIQELKNNSQIKKVDNSDTLKTTDDSGVETDSQLPDIDPI